MDVYGLLIIPLLIFIARAADVTLGTVRILFVSKNLKYAASILGFVEMLIWLIAITKIMQNLTSWVNYVAYAGGFAMGNYIGIVIEEKLAMGKVILRIIAKKAPTVLTAALKKYGYGATYLDAEGSNGPVKIIFMVINRKQLGRAVHLVQKSNPDAFYTVEDVRPVKEGVFPLAVPRIPLLGRFRLSRKGK
jgi:uncharacterized protein YebE (UPF0316 family)